MNETKLKKILPPAWGQCLVNKDDFYLFPKTAKLNFKCSDCLVEFLIRKDHAKGKYKRTGGIYCNSCVQKSHAKQYDRKEAAEKFKKTIQTKYGRGLIPSKEVKKIYDQKYMKENKDKIKERSAKHRKTTVTAKAAYDKQYRTDNRDKIYSRYVEKIKNDLQYRLASYLRRRLRISIKKQVKVGSAVRDLGCLMKELIVYLENQFQEGMTWDNWGMCGWHVDHIKPLASFDLSDPVQLREACHYTNLQPLWAKDNLAKGDRYP